MIKALQIARHVWTLGHDVEVYKYLSELAQENGRGWLFTCSCGKQWSR